MLSIIIKLFFAVLVIAAASFAVAYYHIEVQKEKVFVIVKYNPECLVKVAPSGVNENLDGLFAKAFPIEILIENKSYRTISSMRFRYVIKRPGYSNNLASFADSYHSYKILKPGEKYKGCVKYPSHITYDAGGAQNETRREGFTRESAHGIQRRKYIYQLG